MVVLGWAAHPQVLLMHLVGDLYITAGCATVCVDGGATKEKNSNWTVEKQNRSISLTRCSITVYLHECKLFTKFSTDFLLIYNQIKASQIRQVKIFV